MGLCNIINGLDQQSKLRPQIASRIYKSQMAILLPTLKKNHPVHFPKGSSGATLFPCLFLSLSRLRVTSVRDTGFASCNTSPLAPELNSIWVFEWVRVVLRSRSFVFICSSAQTRECGIECRCCLFFGAFVYCCSVNWEIALPRECRLRRCPRRVIIDWRNPSRE